MSLEQTIKVTLLGLGNMGRNHLRILSMLKNIEIHYIFDVNEETLNNLSAQYGVNSTTDIDVALSGADAAVICSPTSLHYDHFILASKYVKSVFVEKPLADSLEKARKIKDVAEKEKIFVQTGFIERFNPAVMELKNIISKDKAINVDLTRTNKLSSRITDVDVILDLMIHDIDLALYLNGPISDVKAYGLKDNDLVAFASAFFIHENGAFSRVIASRITDKKIRSIQVTCENSFVNSDLLRKEISVSMQSQMKRDSNDAYIISSIEHQVELRPQEALLVELQSFILGCAGKTVSVPGVDAGLDALVVCDNIQRQIK
ncbi:Gfo/Idh/MocA family protein [Paremcibacter congregatus]|uniref:Oxidoreductase n=1 Tax=Paremcibacter congregatus TaxID=2043170 RepID=A0A2G4YRG0_9PROT|nr:Gfo/Idh/MocA family oxidoreductase [Paremcibacter congregatus]PHZ84850.1 oxidoreductase [Paremcibacter congregatus]QDE26177.1 Gfo/Idh/MocA family oxidoreductase [Paremcibacter congregatus]